MKWRLNLVLFLTTIVSVFVAGEYPGPYLARDGLVRGAQFAGALMLILVAHELGHFFTARFHHVDASLPFFIPLPYVSPFGTMGAVIRMDRIPTRRALLDIGASGPLAGLVFAIPLYAWGVAHSQVITMGDGGIELGSSLIQRACDHLFAPHIGPGQDVVLHPVASGAWAGMFVTMLNLLPLSQLDGGHVAYALFGTKQDRYARLIHRAVLVFFFVSLGSYVVRDLRVGFGLVRFGRSVENSMMWLILFELLAILGTLASKSLPHREHDANAVGTRTRIFAIASLVALAMIGEEYNRPIIWAAWAVVLVITLAMERRAGVLRPHDLLDHPPTGAAPLGPGRKAVAWLTLAMFVLLFMPTPFEL